MVAGVVPPLASLKITSRPGLRMAARRSTTRGSSQNWRPPLASGSPSKLTDPSGIVAEIASNAAAVIEMRITRGRALNGLASAYLLTLAFLTDSGSRSASLKAASARCASPAALQLHSTSGTARCLRIALVIIYAPFVGNKSKRAGGRYEDSLCRKHSYSISWSCL
jgi:hypothetical protein